MPLQKIIISAHSNLFLWKISETVEELLSFCKEQTCNEYKKYRSVKHQTQFLAKKLLLKHLQIEKDLFYLDSGKPVLRNNKYISVSHSADWVAIGLSHREIGMDLETARPKLKNIASKFIDDSEKKFFDITGLTDLQLLWTAKESIYKLAGQKGLSFKNDIKIYTFDRNKLEAGAEVSGYGNVSVFYYKIFPDFVLAEAFFDE